ncbi:MAG: hypothetical protein RIR52_1780, partial [Acidobacteriota bacterium]
MKNIRVAAVQFEHASGDKDFNLGRIAEFVTAAAAQDVRLITFPEMCITGYWHVRRLSREQIEQLAEPFPDGPSTACLLDLASRHGMTIGAGLIEQAADGRLYNGYVVALPDGRSFCHRKIHEFISPHIDVGDQYTVFDDPHGCRVGVLTCYDNNIIENARINALLGAEILLAPHQTGGIRSRSPRAMGEIPLEIWHRRHEDPA